MSESMPWPTTSWGESSVSSQQPQPIRFGNNDYMLVPINQGGGLQQQIWTQRSELQRFDSESLKKVKEYRYKKLPGGKKRIRLVQLQTGETQSQDIFCEFIEADYDKKSHVPILFTGDKRSDSGDEKEKPTLPEFYKKDLDVDTDDEAEKAKEKEREKFEKDRWEDLKLKRKRKAEKDSSPEEEEEIEEEAVEPKIPIEYEALSWCWGIDEPKFVVKIRDRGKTFKLRVKRELALALKYLRLPDRARTLWIDAICINQDDPDERNHQVQMMSRIYTRAERVCVWLGEDTPDSKVAIDFIRKEIMELKNFDTICSDKRYTHKWQALMMLMQKPWFSRRWVIQEIALAREAVVYCGTDYISWKEFAISVELFVEVETATHRLSEIMQKDEKFRHVPGWFEYVSELGASILVQATGKVFRAQTSLMSDRQKQIDKVQTIDPLKRRSLLSLEFLVSTMFIFKATEPRDAIYSLLAIARDAAPFAESSFDEDDDSSLTMTLFDMFLEEKRFPIDYSRPYSDVCRDFVRFVIRRKSELDPIQALDILCRPWALAQPKRKSIVVAQNYAEKPTASYKGGLNFPKRSQWRRRICERIPYTDARSGEERRKPVKKAGDKWVKDSRSSKEYFLEADRSFVAIEDQRHQGSAIRVPPLEPRGRWSKYVQWCDDYREKAQIKAKIKAEATEAKKKARKDENDEDRDKDVKREEEKDLELPSWVAQASRAPITLDHHPGMKFVKTGRANADPLVGQPTDGHRNYNAAQTRPVNLNALKFRKRPNLGHHSMYVQGFELDEVSEVEDASQGGDIPVAWLKLGGWIEGEEGFNTDPPDELWRTLVADRGRDNRNPPYYYARACRESVHKGSISSGRVDTEALINNERNSIVAEFCRRVHAVIWNRHMFKTKQGRLGLAFDVKKGDKVCILYGCTVPVILRSELKKPGDHDNEVFEDGKEALLACIRQWEKNCERKVGRLQQNQENKTKWILSGEWTEMMDAKRRAEKQLEEDAAKEEKLQADAGHEESEDNLRKHSGHMHNQDKDGPQLPAANQDARMDGSEDSRQTLTNQDGEISTGREKQPGPFNKDLSFNQPDVSSGKSKVKRMMTFLQKQVEKAKEEDKRHYYSFQGDCYLHGMMDGEAMREKFYGELSDRVFELR